MQAEFKAWLDQALSELEVDADVYGEYIGGIMADDNMPLPDRCAASVDVLATVTERVSAACCGLSVRTRARAAMRAHATWLGV